MQVAIIGSGRLGKAVQQALLRREVPATLHSRSTGFDVLDPEETADLGPADVVVEATDVFTQRAEVARDFFTRSTRAVNAAARNADARHVLVSIVGCEKPELQGNGYYAGKADQERIARAEHANLTVVRSTLWFEFARQNLDRMRFGPVGIVPAMTVQPVSLTAVAEVVADCAVGARSGAVHDVAGPEVTTLWQMTRSLAHRRAALLPVRVPGSAGRALRDGSLLPGPEVEVIGPRFADWLTTSGN